MQWLRTARSRPASPHLHPEDSALPVPNSPEVNPVMFSADHPALEKLRLSENTTNKSSPDYASNRPLMERRETHADSGDATPRRASPTGQATDFPELEKRPTHLADEDQFAIC